MGTIGTHGKSCEFEKMLLCMGHVQTQIEIRIFPLTKNANGTGSEFIESSQLDSTIIT